MAETAIPVMARGGASVLRLLLSEREAGGGEAKWQSGEERGSAAAKAGGVGRDTAGRWCRAANSPAHGRHTACALWRRSGVGAANGRGAARRQAELGRDGLRTGPGSEARGPLR